VPLIGAVALGAEVGSWYVIKQQAQNAADSAAMSAAFAIANSDAQPNFGTLNGVSSPNVTQGSYSPGTGFVSGGTPVNAVQAVVTQCEPQQLSLVIYAASCNGTAKSVMIPALAVASVQQPTTKLPCALALNGSISFHDNGVAVSAPNCSFASNVPAPPASQIGIDLSHIPNTFTIGGLSTSGTCSPSSACSSVSPPVTTYALPVLNPFGPLTSALTSPSTLTLPDCTGSTPQPYTASNQCANKSSISGAITVSGVYFFDGLTLTGNNTLHTCSGASDPDPACAAAGVTQQIYATIILLPGTNLKMTGTTSMNITAPTTDPYPFPLPSQLVPVANSLEDVAIFDAETSPKIGGTSVLGGSGVFYLPNANPLNFQGNPTSASSTCTEVIAASIQFSGSSNYLDNSGCPSSVVPKSQFVVLVQ
jgi:hypothetical protein